MNLQEHIRRVLREEVELNPLEYLGMPEISKIEIGTINDVIINGDLYQFKTQDGLISGVMISPTEFRIEGISANEVGKGQGLKMFESLISYLKSKGVTTLTTESAGEGAVKMHNKSVDKGLLSKVKEDGRFATFTINNTKLDPTDTKSELNQDKRVYDYDKERDTVPERLPFDIDKLVNSGVAFVTPAIDGDPDSETYKEWLEEPYTHLLTLYNVDHSSEDGWIKKAITKGAPTKAYKDNFVDKIYDGKYNQILWGLEKLGINPMDMLIDTNLQENIRRIIREESGLSPRLLRRVPMEKLEKSFGYALKQATIKYYRYQPTLNDDYKLHFFTKEVVELLLDSVSHLMYPTIKGSWYDEEFSNVKKHFKDRITEWWETLD